MSSLESPALIVDNRTKKTIATYETRTMEAFMAKGMNIGSLRRGVGGVSYGQNESDV